MSRRAFLTRASVMGVGAAAAVSGLGALAGPANAAQTRPGRERDVPVDADVPPDLVVHVRDPRTGEVALIAGEAEYVVRDRTLVASVLRTYASSSKE